MLQNEVCTEGLAAAQGKYDADLVASSASRRDAALQALLLAALLACMAADRCHAPAAGMQGGLQSMQLDPACCCS